MDERIDIDGGMRILLFIGCVVAMVSAVFALSIPRQNQNVNMGLVVLILASPCAGVGSLFGRPVIGVLCGLALAGLVFCMVAQVGE